jgi:hypothetical protein
MRTFTLISAAALVGFVSAGHGPLQTANQATVEYADTLQCAGCIRGGYVLCGKSKTGTKCMKPDDAAGIKALQDAGYNCDNGIKGAIGYYAYDVCAEFNNEGCGSKGAESLLVDLPNATVSVSRNISLEYSQGCGYRVVSQCGFPELNITHKGYDITVALHDDTTLNGDPVVNYEFLPNETFSIDYESNANGNLLYKYPGLDDNSTANCSDPKNLHIRKMYVLITNLQKPAEPKPQSFLEEESRMMQTANKTYLNATVSFQSKAGKPDSAFALFSSFAVAMVALFSVLAF